MLFPAMSFCFRRPAPALTCFRTTSTGVKCFARQSDTFGKPPVVVPATGTPALADAKPVPQKQCDRILKKSDLRRSFSRESAGAKNKSNHRLGRKRNDAVTSADQNYEYPESAHSPGLAARA